MKKITRFGIKQLTLNAISQYSSNDEHIILVGDLKCDTASKKDKSSKLMQDIITKFPLSISGQN